MTEVTSNQDRINKMLIEHLGVDAAKITPEARIAEDLGADSLDMIELIMTLEEDFGIEISDDHAATVKTVAQAYALVPDGAA